MAEEEFRQDIIADRVKTNATAILGLTMECARCHDHKYDPLSHVDYYQMRAVFEPLHVRLDPVPGVIDLEKDGLPRTYDLHMDRATWRHARGDEKQEDKSRPMLAKSPHAIAPAMAEVQPVKLPPPAARPLATAPSRAANSPGGAAAPGWAFDGGGFVGGFAHVSSFINRSDSSFP